MKHLRAKKGYYISNNSRDKQRALSVSKCLSRIGLRQALLANAGNKTNDLGSWRVPFATTFHLALIILRTVAARFHPTLLRLKKRREVSPEPHLIAFRRCKNIMDVVDSTFHSKAVHFDLHNLRAVKHQNGITLKWKCGR